MVCCAGPIQTILLAMQDISQSSSTFHLEDLRRQGVAVDARNRAYLYEMDHDFKFIRRLGHGVYSLTDAGRRCL